MVTYVYEDELVSVPSWVVNLESFRRWVDSDDFPETGRIWWLKGEVWIDMSKEQLFSHLMMKNEFNMVIGRIAKEQDVGLYFPDGLFFSNVRADISGNPDATFVSNKALETGDARLIEGKEGGYVELEGSPDMVLEVVSRGSIRKDKVTMRAAYWEAGVSEYWIVYARKESLTFDILRYMSKGYAATRKRDGWMRSSVFGKSFRLKQKVSQLGHPEYSLEIR